jgi:hypothetical protein
LFDDCGRPLESKFQREQRGFSQPRGRQWVATEGDLRNFKALGISERLYETQQDLRAWNQPRRIEIHEEGAGIHASVAQYGSIETMSAFKAKLAQFP